MSDITWNGSRHTIRPDTNEGRPQQRERPPRRTIVTVPVVFLSRLAIDNTVIIIFRKTTYVYVIGDYFRYVSLKLQKFLHIFRFLYVHCFFAVVKDIKFRNCHISDTYCWVTSINCNNRCLIFGTRIAFYAEKKTGLALLIQANCPFFCRNSGIKSLFNCRVLFSVAYYITVWLLRCNWDFV